MAKQLIHIGDVDFGHSVDKSVNAAGWRSSMNVMGRQRVSLLTKAMNGESCLTGSSSLVTHVRAGSASQRMKSTGPPTFTIWRNTSMAHEAKVLLDSISERGHRLTTFEVTMPRIILAEWNTHRMFTRSSASSRAIPVAKMIQRVMEDPYVPTTWGKNQKGMTAAEEILGEDALACEKTWLFARDRMVEHAECLMKIGVHKQLANRLLEPFMWHTIINTATEYSNFFGLRCDKNAQPDMQIVANCVRQAYNMSEPKLLKTGQWHAPYAQGNDELSSQLREITSGRCARVSYLTHDGKHSPTDDIRLHDTLLENRHMAPLEHAARPMDDYEYTELFKQPKVEWDGSKFVRVTDFAHGESVDDDTVYNHFCGNFNGWVQYRKEIPYEDDYGTYKLIHGME